MMDNTLPDDWRELDLATMAEAEKAAVDPRLVAPLVWHWPRTVAATYLAETSIGDYSIVDLGENWSIDRYVLRFDECRVSHFATIEAAKAAAQADYAARILSAIDLDALTKWRDDAVMAEREAIAHMFEVSAAIHRAEALLYRAGTNPHHERMARAHQCRDDASAILARGRG